MLLIYDNGLMLIKKKYDNGLMDDSFGWGSDAMFFFFFFLRRKNLLSTHDNE
jgi:hypothetical protein